MTLQVLYYYLQQFLGEYLNIRLEAQIKNPKEKQVQDDFLKKIKYQQIEL